MSTEGFFRKSTFCTLTEAKPGFDGHWVMPEIFLLNGTFTICSWNASFFLNTFFNSMHWCKSATLKIANLAIFRFILDTQVALTDFHGDEAKKKFWKKKIQNGRLKKNWVFQFLAMRNITLYSVNRNYTSTVVNKKKTKSSKNSLDIWFQIEWNFKWNLCEIEHKVPKVYVL